MHKCVNIDMNKEIINNNRWINVMLYYKKRCLRYVLIGFEMNLRLIYVNFYGTSIFTRPEILSIIATVNKDPLIIIHTQKSLSKLLNVTVSSDIYSEIYNYTDKMKYIIWVVYFRND